MEAENEEDVKRDLDEGEPLPDGFKARKAVQPTKATMKP